MADIDYSNVQFENVFSTSTKKGVYTDTKDTNAYDISRMQYPMNLSEAPEFSGHKVVFFINIQGGGKIATTNSEQYHDIPKGQQTDFNGEKVKEELSKSANLDILKPKKRLKAAIALYVPNALTSTYSVQWGQETAEAMMNGETLSKLYLQATGADPKTNASTATGSGSKFGEMIKTASSHVGSNILNGQKYVQKAIGITPGQSKAQQLFQSVDFREFSFQYSFAPKSEAEAEAVLKIVRMFKHHMLPEYFDDAQYLYIYPSEFEIKYYKGFEENSFIERQYTAVLKRMSINYTSNNQFMTFANGMPTHINIDMSFQELSVPTKESEQL